MYNSYLDKYYSDNNINLSNINDINVNKFSSFIYAVNAWSQILGILLFKCFDYYKRKTIVKNLYDENNYDLSHVETFYLFLKELNFESEIDDINTDDNVINSINELQNIIINNKFDDCCQILGSIEYTYQKISSEIINWYKRKYNKEPKYHYTLHETLDITHAKELFELSDKDIDDKNLEIGAKWILNLINYLVYP